MRNQQQDKSFPSLRQLDYNNERERKNGAYENSFNNNEYREWSTLCDEEIQIFN